MTFSTQQKPANQPKSSNAGKVWLVGAGPGNPDLLTVKALRVIQQADLILFDNLVSEDIRTIFPKSVPAFYVGKRKDDHSIPQKELNSLLVKKARQGLNVVRIKGGDPFVFGRGGEELLTLIEAGIDAEVIPGITSASGCTSAAGIPLTHRGLAQGCTFVTAHGETELNLDWRALAQIGHTLVFYMGVSRAHVIKQNLCMHGLSGSTPVAIIENGCRKNQRDIIGNLGELDALVESQNVQSPALIVVGDVVSLAGKLKAMPELEELAQNCA
ncbi:uroporphyrinogen-III C-methyltransferase [Teredinibacter franksiae]|jgi:uroporphyrinogen-III C-methyltransferase (EC 2.1.1.107)|uniref:uroporphyrinogen-III C-methyltransferase n=1 Tax=Teredinibacter franksiae TaxID=2761453 RepID=UPI001628CF82|nr:uroporphyrinogen-III C-methyltransferase [Teredinibacter franksiae]